MPSRDSRMVARHYRAVQAQLIANGLMRTDGGGRDTPIAARRLADTFVRIALYDEYSVREGRFVEGQTRAALRRWEGPLRVSVRFGDTVPAPTRERDRALIAAYLERLSELARREMVLSESDANVWIYVVSEDERRELAPEWRATIPGGEAAAFRAAAAMELETVCLALGFSRGTSPIYSNALIVVRAELPSLLRLSCYHEEIAQALGLVNDHPSARPSIFNDDEEFATLTRLDEMLLRVLYDPRLRPGMDEATARPIVAEIAAELVGD
jgi:hypothetical protein